MAENKKSFLLYCDIIHTVKKLNDEQAGRLFKHILSYVNDEDPLMDDLIIDLVFEPIKQSLKRDLKRYENICNRNHINGGKGGRPKKEPKKPNGLNNNPKKPKKPDIDSDIDSDIEIEENIYLFDEFWNDYSKKTDTKKCREKWEKIKDAEKLKIKEHVLKYVQSTPEVKYRKDPIRYLTHECWNDEIIIHNNKPKYEHPAILHQTDEIVKNF